MDLLPASCKVDKVREASEDTDIFEKPETDHRYAWFPSASAMLNGASATPSLTCTDFFDISSDLPSLHIPERPSTSTPISDTSISVESEVHQPALASRTDQTRVSDTGIIDHTCRRTNQGVAFEDFIAPFRSLELIMSGLYLPLSYQQCFVQGPQAFRKVHTANGHVKALLQSRNVLDLSERDFSGLADTFLHCIRAVAGRNDGLGTLIVSEMVKALQVHGDMNFILDETELIMLSRRVARVQPEFLPMLWRFTRCDQVSYNLWHDYVLGLRI